MYYEKKLFLLFCLVTVVAFAEKQDQGPNPAPLNPYFVCLGDNGHDTGHCSQRADGLGSVCVLRLIF